MSVSGGEFSYVRSGSEHSVSPESLRPGTQAHLTKRQTEVLRLLVDGYDNAEIASQLGIAVRTVRLHTDALKVKLGARRRSELIRSGRDVLGS